MRAAGLSCGPVPHKCRSAWTHPSHACGTASTQRSHRPPAWNARPHRRAPTITSALTATDPAKPVVFFSSWKPEWPQEYTNASKVPTPEQCCDWCRKNWRDCAYWEHRFFTGVRARCTGWRHVGSSEALLCLHPGGCCDPCAKRGSHGPVGCLGAVTAGPRLLCSAAMLL